MDDTAEAASFYGELFGWTTQDATEGYVLAFNDGRAVAGIGPKPAREMPSNWSTYFASDDADATAEAVRSAGGALAMEPFDVMDQGRMFFAADPSGATFGVWQALNHIGAGVVNEPGALAWNELHSRDLDGSREFYGRVSDSATRT